MGVLAAYDDDHSTLEPRPPYDVSPAAVSEGLSLDVLRVGDWRLAIAGYESAESVSTELLINW